MAPDLDLADLMRRQGIRDERVLGAIAALDRSDFVIGEHKALAGGNFPLPIGHGQTISQPYVVAFMTEALQLSGREKVLEIGTGSGYQTAVLARVCADVYSIEIVSALHERAARALAELRNVHLRFGDGYKGWPEEAPFDAILLTAAPPKIPDRLLEQLAVGGRLVAPVGHDADSQDLVRVTKTEHGDVHVEKLLAVRFVPMVPAH